ncbi:ComF family protein [Thiorhodospira sibirica]|uniref:ComF family protein n=1 Tax=Thiorhodospira sibirica TaxID=154347 RepID=UPI000314D5F3|nr:ComF family protein [Thiorhodospira sibirica]
MWLKTAIQRCTAILYPIRCLLCGAPGQPPLELCASCIKSLPWLGHGCRCCAMPLPPAQMVCGECLHDPPPFDASYAAFHYQPPIDRLIIQLKHHDRLAYARVLGQLFIQARQALQEPLPPKSCILPVPLHRSRLRERGFNQSMELARMIAPPLHLPVCPALAQRQRATQFQQGLKQQQRRLNVRNAFAASGTLPAHIIILDDVMTTGSTLRELASTLKKAGAHQVETWCIARTSH